MLSASQGVLTAALFDLFGDLFVRGMAAIDDTTGWNENHCPKP
jgi:hypothetical protein